MRLPSKTPLKILTFGCSSGPIVPATCLLEVVVLTTVEDTHLAIHAMPMRARFGRLLES